MVSGTRSYNYSQAKRLLRASPQLIHVRRIGRSIYRTWELRCLHMFVDADV